MSTIGSLIGVIDTLFAVVYILFRVYPKQSEPARSAVLAFMICLTLLGIVCAVNLAEDLYLPVPRLAYYLSHSSFPLAILIGGFSVEILLRGRAPTLLEIVRRPVVILTVVALGLMLTLLFRTPDPISFIRPEAIRLQSSYLGAYIIYYSLKAVLLISNALPLIATLRQPLSPVLRARYLLGLIGTLIGPFCIILMLLLPIVGPRYNEPFIFFVQTIGRSAVFIFLLVGYVLPDRAFHRVAGPLLRWFERRDANAQVLLRELHQAMIAVAPSVHLSQINSTTRMLVEISDARMLLWSQATGYNLCSPRHEARYLHHLLQRGVTIDRWGERQPEVPRSNVIAYNLAVARHLRDLQHHSDASTMPAPVKRHS